MKSGAILHLLHPSRSCEARDLAHIPAAVEGLLSELRASIESTGLPRSAAIPPMTRDGSFCCNAHDLDGYPVRVCTEYSHAAQGWIVTVHAILQCPTLPIPDHGWDDG